MRATTRQAGTVGDERSREAGFGFVEALIAMMLMSVAALSVSQMMITGIYVSEASADLTSVTTMASQQMEILKSEDFDDLDAGGALGSSVTGYSDTVDLDGDGTGEFTRRWRVLDLGLSKQIDVYVVGPPTAIGEAREIQLTAVVVEKQ